MVWEPLHTLYFRGPTSLGFWGGAAEEDICFTLTGTTSLFWIQHMDECTTLTHQKFDAFTTVVMFVFYFTTLYRLCTVLAFHVCFTQPILRELRDMRMTYLKQ